jgi:hypothetical protein
MAFLDKTDTLKANVKVGWAKFGPRRLFHYVLQMMSLICDQAENDKKHLWEQSPFIQRLMDSMHVRSSSTQPTDIPGPKRYILWKTDPSRFIRYGRLRPVIVGNLNASHDLPTKKQRLSRASTIFDFSEEETGERDGFFKWIHANNTDKNGRDPQLNNLMLGRIVVGISDKYQPVNKNSPAWREHYHFLKLKKKLNLGVFWESTDKFKKAIMEFRRKVTVLPAQVEQTGNTKRYRANSTLWEYRGGATGHGPIYLFIYPATVEATMDGHLKKGNWIKAILYAQQGYLTENFLSFLIKAKKCHGKLPGGNKTPAFSVVSPSWMID